MTFPELFPNLSGRFQIGEAISIFSNKNLSHPWYHKGNFVFQEWVCHYKWKKIFGDGFKYSQTAQVKNKN